MFCLLERSLVFFALLHLFEFPKYRGGARPAEPRQIQPQRGIATIPDSSRVRSEALLCMSVSIEDISVDLNVSAASQVQSRVKSVMCEVKMNSDLYFTNSPTVTTTKILSDWLYIEVRRTFTHSPTMI